MRSADSEGNRVAKSDPGFGNQSALVCSVTPTLVAPATPMPVLTLAGKTTGERCTQQEAGGPALDVLMSLWAAVFQQQLLPPETPPTPSGTAVSLQPKMKATEETEPRVAEGAACPQTVVAAPQKQSVAMFPVAELAAGTPALPASKDQNAKTQVLPPDVPSYEGKTGEALPSVLASLSVAPGKGLHDEATPDMETLPAQESQTIPVANPQSACGAIAAAPQPREPAPLETKLELKRAVSQRLARLPTEAESRNRDSNATEPEQDAERVLPVRLKETETVDLKEDVSKRIDLPPPPRNAELPVQPISGASPLNTELPAPPPVPIETFSMAKPVPPVVVPPRPPDLPPPLPVPGREANTISIRIPFTDAGGSAARHIDLVFQNRNNDLTLQVYSPTAEIQQRIEASMPTLLDKLQTADWTAKPADLAQNHEVVLETRKRSDAGPIPAAIPEVVRDIPGAASSPQAGFRFDEQGQGHKDQTPQSTPAKNRKKERVWQSEFDAQTEAEFQPIRSIR
ncbi:hypothetical protein [Bryobacter aggregatus]|uniref:hypothetical protein n=1 Tax=Bryobacter aggregatus TaxID=360054 RepID=UPI0004E282FF|nr:hypothetical protein [Bryobacter aggregatus]